MAGVTSFVGAVLHEMVTESERLRESQLSVASAILEKEPELSAQQTDEPPALEHA